jgi:predicted transcriptional regulator of viral defense system
MTSKPKEILSKLARMPYFTIGGLSVFNFKATYLRVFLSRLEKRGDIIRIKRGFYVSRAYCAAVKNRGKWTQYLEFLAAKAYSPAYLSLDYVLYKHNLLTEAPVNFTLATANKTAVYKNALGLFSYHKIKEPLFCGYKTAAEGGFPVHCASKAKALFDFIYLRRKLLANESAFKALRLNLALLSKADIAEFKKYSVISKTAKMSAAADWIINAGKN